MMRGLAAFALAAILLSVLGAGSGCSDGVDIPLLPPGGSQEWPLDTGWFKLPGPEGDYSLRDGVWNTNAGPDEPLVVLVGSTVLEYRAGRWSDQQLTDGDILRSVVQTASGTFVAVGSDGVAYRREGDSWQPEDTGTEESLYQAVASGEIVWAVGSAGTVRRREAGVWTGLPTVGTDDSARSVAALHDSLFVVSIYGDLWVWGGEDWAQVADVPQPESPDDPFGVRGVVTAGDGKLYAAVDSLYVREPTGWRTVTDVAFSGFYDVKFKVTGNTIWYGLYNFWWHVDPTTAPWQPSTRVPFSSWILAPRDADNYFASDYEFSVVWVEDGQARTDPASRIAIYGHVLLDSEEMMFMTDLGVSWHNGSAVVQVLDGAQVPLVTRNQFEAGCGPDRDDYYLVGRSALYHVVAGQATLLGEWADELYVNSAAVGADGRLYVGGGDGLWRWQDGSWHRELPVLDPEEYPFHVWPLGDGRLGGLYGSYEHYYQQDGRWLALGALFHESVLTAGAGGTLFAVSRGSEGNFGDGNRLLVLDEWAGAFRDLEDQGMGPLADLRLAGATSRDGEALLWTTNPTMVFTLEGPPRNANWRVVAGPFDGNIERLTRLPDGRLLAKSGNSRDFYLYGP